MINSLLIVFMQLKKNTTRFLITVVGGQLNDIALLLFTPVYDDISISQSFTTPVHPGFFVIHTPPISPSNPKLVPTDIAHQ